MKKRILFVSESELCIAGVPHVIMKVVRQLKGEYVFDIVTFSDKKGFYDSEFESYGGHIYRLPLLECNGIKRVLYPYRNFQIKKYISKLLNSMKYDVVHGCSGWNDGICLGVAKKKNVPIRISHSHGIYSCKYKNIFKSIALWLTKHSIGKSATVCLACSDLAGYSLFGNKKFFNVLNSVDINYYNSVQKKSHSGINLLQIGYFCKLKNQMFSIELLANLRKRGIDAHLALVGYPCELFYFEKMREKIQELKLDEFVQILAPDSDKRLLFSVTDYVLLPSLSEGLPLVALESQASNIVCLMSDNISRDSNIGASEFIEHNNVIAWTNTIINGIDYNEAYLKNNLVNFSNEAFVEKISSHY